jgi:hypothetical protein
MVLRKHRHEVHLGRERTVTAQYQDPDIFLAERGDHGRRPIGDNHVVVD